MTRRDMALAAIIALTAAGLWYGYRYYNTAALDASIGFDYAEYTYTVDTAGGVNEIDWSNYEPLSLEIP